MLIRYLILVCLVSVLLFPSYLAFADPKYPLECRKNSNHLAINTITNTLYVSGGYYSWTDINLFNIVDGSKNNIISSLKLGTTTEKPGAGTSSVAMMPEKNLVYAIYDWGGTLLLFDDNTKTELNSNKITGRLNGIDVDSSKNLVYVTRVDPTLPGGFHKVGYDSVAVFDGSTLNVLDFIEVGDKPGDIRVNQKTGKIYLTHNDSDFISVIDGSEVNSIKVGSEQWKIAINPNNNKVYVLHTDTEGTLTILDGNSDSIINRIPLGGQPRAIDVNLNTNEVYVAHCERNYLTVIDGNSNGVSRKIDLGLTHSQGITINSITNTIYVPYFAYGIIAVFEDEKLSCYIPIPSTKFTLDRRTLQIESNLCKSSNPPQIEVISPNGGESLQESLIVHWQSSDPDGDALFHAVALSFSDGKSWVTIEEGITGNSFNHKVPSGLFFESALVKVTASDGTYTVFDTSDGSFSVNKETGKHDVRDNVRWDRLDKRWQPYVVEDYFPEFNVEQIETINEVVEKSNLPPKKQLKLVESPEKIVCNEGLQLIFKSTNNSPACVKPKTAEKLIERGWASN